MKMSSRLCSHTYVSFSLQENHVIHVLSLMIMFYTYFRRPKILTSLHAICLPRLAKIFRNPRQAYQHQPAISLRATAPLDCLQVCLQKFNKMKKNDASVTSRKQNGNLNSLKKYTCSEKTSKLSSIGKSLG